MLAGAAGVHVGQDDLTPRDVRTIAGDECVVGLSTHTDEQIEEAMVGNICRCGTYNRIKTAIRQASTHLKEAKA